MFVKLAFRNVRRQIRNYLIYFVTVALSIAMMFAVNNLCYSPQIRSLADAASDVKTMFNTVTVLCCLVTALVLSYATGFMLKLRKKEFGMYLTLGMTRRNIQTLFACETGLLSGLALAVGMAAGLVIYQFLAALFAYILDIAFTISSYSMKGILLTIAVSLGLFVLSTLASLRYLKTVTVSELLKEDAVETIETHSGFWCVLSLLTTVGLVAVLIVTYRSLMAAFHSDGGLILLLWLALDLVMIFLFHFTGSKALTGLLLHSHRLKNSGTNAVVLRGLSEKITVNALLLGALATLLVFAVCMCNVAFGDKIFTGYSVKKDCPYDVMAMFDLSEEHGISMEEGRAIVERYSPITRQTDYRLYSMEDDALSRHIRSYGKDLTDKFMPLTQFNALLTDCGYDPISLGQEVLLVKLSEEIDWVDSSEQSITLNGITYPCTRSATNYPEFTKEWFYFVIPDEALTGMPVSDIITGYTLKNPRIQAQALVDDLTFYRQTEDGLREARDFRVQEYYRLYLNANTGTLIIGTLYVSTVFVCMALAILSIKTLSTLDDQRKRYAILYRLGADASMQKAALFKEIGAFFLLPYTLPLLMTVPLGMLFGEIYQIWNFSGLTGQKAMETALLISLVLTGIYTLYFFITYRITCDHVICHGSENNHSL